MTAPAATATERAPLTQSRMRAFRRCDRFYRLRYVDGIRPLKIAETLRDGSLVHVGLEAWWKALRDGAPGDTPLERALEAIHAEAPSDLYALIRAVEMMRGYHFRWIDETPRVLYVEQKFIVPHVNPATGAPSRTWNLAGKIDAGIRDINGRHLVVEHKTSSEDISPGSNYWLRLRMDPQVSQYLIGGSALEHGEVLGCVYDVLKKPKLRPYRATPEEARNYTKDGRLYKNQRDHDETPAEYQQRVCEEIASEPDAYYMRQEIVRLPGEIADFREIAWQTGVNIQNAEARDAWPRNPDACERYGRLCELFDVCSGHVDQDDPLLYVRVTNPDSELEDEQ